MDKLTPRQTRFTLRNDRFIDAGLLARRNCATFGGSSANHLRMSSTGARLTQRIAPAGTIWVRAFNGVSPRMIGFVFAVATAFSIASTNLGDIVVDLVDG